MKTPQEIKDELLSKIGDNLDNSQVEKKGSTVTKVQVSSRNKKSMNVDNPDTSKIGDNSEVEK